MKIYKRQLDGEMTPSVRAVICNECDAIVSTAKDEQYHNKAFDYDICFLCLDASYHKALKAADSKIFGGDKGAA